MRVNKIPTFFRNFLLSTAMDGEDIFNYLVLDFFIEHSKNKIRIKIFHRPCAKTLFTIRSTMEQRRNLLCDMI